MQTSQDFQPDLIVASMEVVGGEPLGGSGFENEETEPGFSAAELEGEM